MIISTIAAVGIYVGDKVLGNIIANEVNKRISRPAKYKNRLRVCVYNTVVQYKESKDTQCPGDKFLFCESQILLNYLSNYILFNDYSEDIIIEELKNNPRVLEINAEELNDFFSLFLENIYSDELLKTLFINESYKSRIYDNSLKLHRAINKLDN